MNINAMMQQAKKMQEKMEQQQKELSKKEFVTETQGVKVTMFGNKKVKSIDINEILIDPEDKDMLQDMIVITINNALEKIENVEEELSPKMPSGMPI